MNAKLCTQITLNVLKMCAYYKYFHIECLWKIYHLSVCYFRFSILFLFVCRLTFCYNWAQKLRKKLSKLIAFNYFNFRSKQPTK